MNEQVVADATEIDAVIEHCGTNPASAIPILLGLQELYGYLPVDALRYVTDHTEITPDQIYGVATFYTQFRLEPVGEHIIRVCHGTSCHVQGSVQITQTIQDILDLEGEGTTADKKYTLQKVACLGCCSLAPVMMIDDDVYGGLSRKKVRRIFKKLEREDAEQ